MLGLAMRWKYGAWAPLHANSHGIAELRGLAKMAADACPTLALLLEDD